MLAELKQNVLLESMGRQRRTAAAAEKKAESEAAEAQRRANDPHRELRAAIGAALNVLKLNRPYTKY